MNLEVKFVACQTVDLVSRIIPDHEVQACLINFLNSSPQLPKMDIKSDFIPEFETILQAVLDPNKTNFDVVVTDEHDDSYVDVGVLNKRGDIVAYIALVQKLDLGPLSNDKVH